MAKQSWLKNKLAQFRDDFEFRLESLILNLTERICIKMKQKGINRIELAGLLNVSPPAVTKILNGSSNFTLKTLLSISDALGQDIEIRLVDKNVVSAYTYVNPFVDDVWVAGNECVTFRIDTPSSGDYITYAQEKAVDYIPAAAYE